MDKQDILRVIARQLLKQRNHLDALAQTSDWTESAKDAYDQVVSRQRTDELKEIEALREAKEEDILWILEELGPGLAIEYLQSRAGSAELGAHRPLYAASVKFGFPDLTWDEAREQARVASPMRLKNPQMQIFQGWKESFETDFTVWKRQAAECDSLPYLSDRFYMNGVIRNLFKGDPLAREDKGGMQDPLRLSKILFAAAVTGWEQIKDQSHLDDEELRLCALVTFACQELPGYSDFEERWHSEEPAPVLRHIDKAIATLENMNAFFQASTACPPERKTMFAVLDASRLADLRTLRDRIEGYADAELFNNPVTCAHRIYDHLESLKLTRLVTPVLEQDHWASLKSLNYT